MNAKEKSKMQLIDYANETRQGLHRRYEMILSLSADSLDDLIGHLHHLEYIIRSEKEELGEGRIMNSTSGGHSTSHICYIDHDPKMTHDQWSKELDEYLIVLRNEDATKKVVE